MLLADLVLAEAARQQGRIEEAVARLLEHSEYIQTESANLVLAFYVRAFPGLLGVLARAVGPARLPIHMLRLIGDEEAVQSLEVAWDEMPPEEWSELADRLMEPDDVEALRSALSTKAPCTVKLFGGLEVTTPDGDIPDRAWRKRKARLLFAMLVCRRGQDVPREQVLEYLWPEMDEEKARNNFYVVWNNLKTALSPNLDRRESCPFVESVGGLCRIQSDVVRSDLDDFGEALATARDAEAEGDDEAALRAYRELDRIYGGDLLPGDVYDDWFGSLRDRCRQQFGDAMLNASRLYDTQGRSDATLHALRRGLEVDPLREDLYQEMLRCQIESGMRSAAVETFMTCRSRLSEELGLDPSTETSQLYEQVLAMEDGPSLGS
jgi:DNA-binding SARP family transcriptional activator